ncbi:LysR family transcriptional regulator [Sphingomonas crusticola]|uniref:LysR family transcriptional regulator n=1 Tax=Sphingomonas crusticola TaxID=1697973 RepID=UPI000E2206C6|nr:LysR family transcriptional regulator [Sphingomonas crusticola]
MMKLDGLAAFVAAAEAGSISEAARRLGLAKSVVSERLAELERSVGTRLLQRTTRKLSITEDGRLLLPRAHRILFEAREAAAEITERGGTLSGSLRISVPVSFGVLHLGPALYDFLAKHPAIDLTLELDDRFVDAAADGYDAVIRHGPIGDSRLVARRLATTRRMLVASPDYLARAGTPRSIEALEGHRGIIYTNREADWRFDGPSGWTVVRPRAALRVNNGIVMRDAALAGAGITLLPTFFIHQELAAGALQRIDVGYEAEGGELFIAHPRARTASSKITALTEALRAAFGDPPYWDR